MDNALCVLSEELFVDLSVLSCSNNGGVFRAMTSLLYDFATIVDYHWW